MKSMTKIERVMAVIEGQQPDRPPLSFWYHFRADQRAGDAAVRAHLEHAQQYDLDFLKVMYDLGYPHSAPIRTADDLAALKVLQGDEDVFGQHLEVIRTLSSELGGRVPTSTTLFNAWATLRRLLTTEAYNPQAGPSPLGTPKTIHMTEFVAEHRTAVATALGVIGQSLGNFAAKCIEAGSDGIFLSVRDDWVEALEAGSYQQLVRESDLDILAGAASGRLNILHVCGQAVNFAAFCEYPVHMINWADRMSGPSISSVAGSIKPALCAGIHQLETLVHGSEQDCVAEVQDTLAQAGDTPIAVAPGCTYDPEQVPERNLHALKIAVSGQP